MHLLHVIGAPPNFMKAAPALRACAARGMLQTLVHTGQDYDCNMPQVFLEQLGLPVPDFNLEVGSGSHAEQTAQVILHLEPVLPKECPDWVMAYGDVNPTLAAVLVYAKLPLPIAHVEAGLGSFDWSMPGEINRVVTDRISDLLFTPPQDANANLLLEGVAAHRIHFVGNVMIDTLGQGKCDVEWLYQGKTGLWWST
jgi:UDP-N-acetylglucosamine 2-epimerase (non-hydrolysing)